MIKHFCDRCDEPCDPRQMVVLSGYDRTSLKPWQVGQYNPTVDRYDVELCRACADQFAAQLGVIMRGGA